MPICSEKAFLPARIDRNKHKNVRKVTLAIDSGLDMTLQANLVEEIELRNEIRFSVQDLGIVQK
jgi:hypothetical protein